MLTAGDQEPYRSTHPLDRSPDHQHRDAPPGELLLAPVQVRTPSERTTRPGRALSLFAPLEEVSVWTRFRCTLRQAGPIQR